MRIEVHCRAVVYSEPALGVGSLSLDMSRAARMAGLWRECLTRLPHPTWPCLPTGTCGAGEDESKDGRSRNHAAERDICRLKWNWLFAMLVSMIGSLNTTCILPTNHQFIINPTHSNRNTTDEEIEPGLQLGEEFYSLTYSMLFVGNSVAALSCGLLFNLIPTWYLLLATILVHITSYLFYSLATSGWMMLLARGLAGLAMGSSVAITFSYFGVSYVKYVEDLKELDRYEERAAARTKGFIFSLFNVGNVLGYAIGGGFPIILAQFPETPQFRPAGWFCVAIGVVLLLLQLVLFHGECAWNCNRATFTKCPTRLPSCARKTVDEKLFCNILIPAFLIVVGGVKGIRYLIPIMMMAPIVADSFGYSEKDSAYLTSIFFVGTVLGLVFTYVLQFFKVGSYALTVTGLVCTIIGLLMMTDWQAIGNDPCTAYSILHHPQLIEFYREELREHQLSTGEPGRHQHTRWCSTQTWNGYSSNNSNSTDMQEVLCRPVNSDPNRAGSVAEVKALFQVEYLEPEAQFCFDRVEAQGMRKLRTGQSIGDTICCKPSHSSALSRTASSCFLFHKSNVSIDESLLTWVHVQSLQAVEGDVYQMAVNRCQSAGEHCHWIPNSPVTHKHCSDCQPICRDTRRTLHFAQFGIGLLFFFSTLTFLFTGIFLLLSDTVSKSFQGLSMGLLVALSGLMKIVSPIWMDTLYEEAEKRTYLLMLTMVGLFLPLLVGLLLLQPWIREQVQLNQDSDRGEEDCELIPAGTFTDSDN